MVLCTVRQADVNLTFTSSQRTGKKMKPEWQKILSAVNGLEENHDGLVQPAEARAESVICPLLSETVLHVTGDGAELFLQAQFSNDIAALELPGSHLTTWSSLKGRVITLLRVLKIADGFLLRLPTEMVEPVLKRLRMFASVPVMKDGKPLKQKTKITIEPRDDLLVVGISGDKAVATLTESGTSLPEKTDATSELAAGGWVTRVRDNAGAATPRFEIVADSKQVAQYWSDLSQASVAAAEAAWRLQNIDAGVPSIYAANTESFVLQMLNLQHIDGVSFKKGCFPGQEVVARMQYLGKLKRQMVRLQHVGSAVPKAGDEIFKEGRDTAVGKVVDAVGEAGNSCRMLAVMAIAELSEKLYLDKNAEYPLELLDLPYETPLAS